MAATSRPNTPTGQADSAPIPPNQTADSPTRRNSATSRKSASATPAKHKASNRLTYRNAGASESQASQTVNEHLGVQCKDNTVVVDTALLLAHAQPRNVAAAASADRIFATLRDSTRLTDFTGDLQTLVEGRCANESATYPGIKQFFGLIARAVYDDVAQFDPAHPVRQETRLLQSTGQFDYAPKGSDNRNRPDIPIIAQAVPDNGFPGVAVKAAWSNIALVVEGKWDKDKVSKGSEPAQTTVDGACGQLARYILSLYTSQPNRRFAWALLTYNTFVYVCLFGRDHVYRTQAIDLSTLPGRQLFAQFVIFWSLAGPAQFGLDPTMEFDATTECWAIQCFDDACTNSTPTPQVYYAPVSTMSIRPSLFGRRTMTFLASKQPNGDPSVFIKDAWPVASVSAADDDLRNEIVLLRHIHQVFSGNDPGVPYPRLEMGGTVWQCNHGQWEQDDDTTAYGNFEAALPPQGPESAAPIHRVHRRMVMTPIAEPLSTLKNFNELIVVLADAMVCHGKLYKECNIFHRDISTNNIMVVRHDGRLRGMLIDFDNAIHDEAQSTPGRPERTGTLPFMSIGNLENNDTKRTALDDWESLLYVVCWLGTYGLDEEARAGATQAELLELKTQHWGIVASCHLQTSNVVVCLIDDARNGKGDTMWPQLLDVQPEQPVQEYCTSVERTRNHTLVVSDVLHLLRRPSATYHQLSQYIHCLASVLQSQHGVTQETHVAFLGHKSLASTVAMMATMLAGGAIIPIDCQFPSDRVAYILHDSGCQVLPDAAQVPAEFQGAVVDVDGYCSMSGAQLASLAPVSLAPQDLAYIIYTSGTTGRPKGVMIEYGCLESIVLHSVLAKCFQPGQVCLQFFSVAFDLHLFVLFSALTHGCTLRIMQDEDALGDVQCMDMATMTPSFLAHIDPISCSNVQTIIVTGEACPQALVDK
ncbi:hypothetical protein H4R35_005957 [Dimargaris xerosporica]|nr:hypothetical protein H4R35_005957 [Dimargaris xerosporica]